MLFSSNNIGNQSNQIDLGAVDTPVCPSLTHNHQQVSCRGAITVAWLHPSLLIVHHLSFWATLCPPSPAVADVTAQSNRHKHGNTSLGIVSDQHTAAQYCAAQESWLGFSRAAPSLVFSVGTWMWSCSRWWMHELLMTRGMLSTNAHTGEGPGLSVRSLQLPHPEEVMICELVCHLVFAVVTGRLSQGSASLCLEMQVSW